jgi:hypothetical protein
MHSNSPDDGTIKVEYWADPIGVTNGVGPNVCTGTPTETFTFTTGSAGCTSEDFVDDDDQPLDKLYPDNGDFVENAWMRVDCVKTKAPSPKAKKAKKVAVKAKA